MSAAVKTEHAIKTNAKRNGALELLIQDSVSASLPETIVLPGAAKRT
jgi:hypothetical protein